MKCGLYFVSLILAKLLASRSVVALSLTGWSSDPSGPSPQNLPEYIGGVYTVSLAGATMTAVVGFDATPAAPPVHDFSMVLEVPCTRPYTYMHSARFSTLPLNGACGPGVVSWFLTIDGQITTTSLGTPVTGGYEGVLNYRSFHNDVAPAVAIPKRGVNRQLDIEFYPPVNGASAKIQAKNPQVTFGPVGDTNLFGTPGVLLMTKVNNLTMRSKGAGAMAIRDAGLVLGGFFGKQAVISEKRFRVLGYGFRYGVQTPNGSVDPIVANEFIVRIVEKSASGQFLRHVLNALNPTPVAIGPATPVTRFPRFVQMLAMGPTAFWAAVAAAGGLPHGYVSLWYQDGAGTNYEHRMINTPKFNQEVHVGGAGVVWLERKDVELVDDPDRAARILGIISVVLGSVAAAAGGADFLGRWFDVAGGEGGAPSSFLASSRAENADRNSGSA